MSTCTTPAVPFLDLSAQFAGIQLEIKEAIAQVLNSTCFVGGEWVDRFEEEFSRYVGAKYAIGVASGTDALEIALKASGLGAGDDVIVPANSFFATAEAVSNVGARPVFADVKPDTFHLDIDSVEQVRTEKTRAIVPVHLYGRAMDTRELQQYAQAHHLVIIEDAAQAHGSVHRGQKVGGSGNLCCFSFYPGKNLGACGDAGCVTVADPDVANRIRLLRDHGSPFKYQHRIVGRNSRLDAIQAAVLCVKLPHLDEWNEKRREHARIYVSLLSDSAVRTPEIPSGREHNFHLFVIRTSDRDRLRNHLLQSGISSGVHYPVPLHLTQAYQELDYPGVGTLPVCEQLAQEILSLPMFPELTEEQIRHTAETILAFSRG